MDNKLNDDESKRDEKRKTAGGADDEVRLG